MTRLGPGELQTRRPEVESSGRSCRRPCSANAHPLRVQYLLRDSIFDRDEDGRRARCAFLICAEAGSASALEHRVAIP